LGKTSEVLEIGGSLVTRNMGACCAECGVWAEDPDQVIHADSCSLAEAQAEEFYRLGQEIVRQAEARLRQLRRLK
jgi:hypothetical protein